MTTSETKWLRAFATRLQGSGLDRWARELEARFPAKRRRPEPEHARAPGKPKEREATISAEQVRLLACGFCEVCGLGGDEGEVHHLLSGPTRRRTESPVNMVLLCRSCHRAYHRHDLDVMGAVLKVSRLSVTARAAVERRISKVRALRAPRSGGNG